jgi:hypothetical protein
MCQQFISVVNDTGEVKPHRFVDTDNEFIIGFKLSMMNALPV